MSKSVGSINKSALKRILYQTELHNRVQEEQDMWRLRLKEKMPSSRKRSKSPAEPPKKIKKNIYNVTIQSTCDRWGHSGFIEQHPEEVISGKCFEDNSDSDIETKKKKKKKNKKSKKKKHKKEKHQNVLKIILIVI